MRVQRLIDHKLLHKYKQPCEPSTEMKNETSVLLFHVFFDGTARLSFKADPAYIRANKGAGTYLRFTHIWFFSLIN